ncbi:GlyGly-CTERM sorting domain-containing protein [Aeromonas jandaei]|nr:GlyGly-CTERM sorting domain-containing protein [Aeromonas jandaei]
MLQQPELIKAEEKGDPWVNVPRTLNFRLVARDGKGGGAYDETSVEVVDTGSQTFKILPAPDQRILVGSPTTVNWQVAGTDGGRINCQRVDISYSNDEGKSWQPLVNGVNNNGAHEVTIPANAGSAVRLKLACSDNIFYAITPKLATKSSDTPAPQPESNGGGGGGGSTGLFALLGLGIAALLRRRETISY